MPQHAPSTILAAALCLIVLARVSVAAEAPGPAKQNSAFGLQQQIDELKRSQERMLKELEEIKSLLRELPTRSELNAQAAAPQAYSLDVQGEPFRGDNRARVAIIEYSDFNCSFCARYQREIYPRIDQEFIKPGKVKYYFRDLPEPGQTNSMLKARAARCAGEQGKFWELHDLLFAEHAAKSDLDLGPYVQALGLDATSFNACLESDRFADNIRFSVAGAKKIGLKGTPGFLIGTVSDNGDSVLATKVFVGAESFESFKSMLDELLAAQAKK
jgi:protein-disulfide isomerase